MIDSTVKFWKRVTPLVLGAATVLALIAGPAIANQGAAAEKKAYWQKKYSQIITRASGAELRVAATRAAVRKMRQRDRPRGADRANLYVELETAEAEYETAAKQLADFPAEARQAGIPAGWLREVEDATSL